MDQQPLSRVTLQSFEQLEAALLNWRSFLDADVYDVAGMMALFCACLHNLDNNATSDELEELSDTLTDEEKSFLGRLCG